MYSNTMHCWPEGIRYFTLCINVDSFLMVLCICVTVHCRHCTFQCNALLHRSSLRALFIPIQCIVCSSLRALGTSLLLVVDSSLRALYISVQCIVAS